MCGHARYPMDCPQFDIHAGGPDFRLQDAVSGYSPSVQGRTFRTVYSLCRSLAEPAVGCRSILH